MKEFAKTLFYYSPKAYKYVRMLFRLPHHSTIRSWMSTMECEPGFLEGLKLGRKGTKSERVEGVVGGGKNS